MNTESIIAEKTFETTEGTLKVVLFIKKQWDDRGHSGIEENLYLKRYLNDKFMDSKHIYHRCPHSSTGDWGKYAYEIVGVKDMKVELRHRHNSTFFV